MAAYARKTFKLPTRFDIVFLYGMLQDRGCETLRGRRIQSHSMRTIIYSSHGLFDPFVMVVL